MNVSFSAEKDFWPLRRFNLFTISVTSLIYSYWGQPNKSIAFYKVISYINKRWAFSFIAVMLRCLPLPENTVILHINHLSKDFLVNNDALINCPLIIRSEYSCFSDSNTNALGILHLFIIFIISVTHQSFVQCLLLIDTWCIHMQLKWTFANSHGNSDNCRQVCKPHVSLSLGETEFALFAVISNEITLWARKLGKPSHELETNY